MKRQVPICFPPHGAALLACLLAVMLAAGCVTIGNSQTPTPLVTLEARPSEAPLRAQPWPLQLGIAFPESRSSLRTDRIALMRGREILYLSNAKWDSHTAPLLLSVMERYLSASGCFRAVSSELSAQSAGLRLESGIDMFHLVYGENGGAPTATIVLRLTLLDKGSGEALGSTTIQQTMPAASEKLEDLLTAMDGALNAAMNDTTRWVADTVNAQMPLLKRLHRL